MAYKVPDNEAQRLDALAKFDILDTAEEVFYDNITELAASIMNTPIALISFVDGNRQWFKSKVGLSAQETDRDSSFCSHAILAPNKSFIINDARLDKRFEKNPLVLGGPNIRFYFGSPLVTEENEAIGTVCVIDDVPREDPTPVQVDSMKSLSKLVMIHLEHRKFIIEMSEQIKNLAVQKTTPENNFVETVEVLDFYKDLNVRCDEILEKIKAKKALRKEKRDARDEKKR